MGEAKRRRALGLTTGAVPNQSDNASLLREAQVLRETEESTVNEMILAEHGNRLTPAGVWAVALQAQGLAVDLAASHPDPTIACRAGCAWCCVIPVDVGALEAMVIAAWLRASLATETLAALRAQIKSARGKVEGRTFEQRVAQRLPCPMLTADLQCGVYPVRPGTCIAYTSRDAGMCQAFAESKDPTFNPRRQTSGSMKLAGGMPAVAQAALVARGAPPPRALELIIALDIALEHPDAPERWLAGEPLFAPAERTAADLVQIGELHSVC